MSLFEIHLNLGPVMFPVLRPALYPPPFSKEKLLADGDQDGSFHKCIPVVFVC